MLCVIPHSRKYAKYIPDSYYRKQVNNVIKKLFRGLSEYIISDTQHIFLTEYTDFDNNDGLFYGDEFICKSKDIRDVNSHLWYPKYLLPCTKVLDFVACRFTSTVLGIGAAEHSWGDLKTIKSGKISTIGSDVS